jgi:hypothetical protein
MFFFLLGAQLRLVDSYVLNEKASRFVEEKFGSKRESAGSLYPSLAASGYDPYLLASLPGMAAIQAPRKTVTPPRWLAWSLMSAGAVMVLGYPCFRS